MIYAIGDLHFDHSLQKRMDIFGDKWINHDEKIIDNWKSVVNNNDIVLIPGDISWALKLDEAIEDLKLIDKLPGKKILIRGNHDYWWEGQKKLNSLELNNCVFLKNNAYNDEFISIGGSRGWQSRDSEDFDQSDEKIFLRELARLELSLSKLDKDSKKKIAMLHYPPFDINKNPNEFSAVLKRFCIDICVYGHLHACGHKNAVEGKIDGIEYHLVSSDYLNFNLKKILEV